jgi:hypothetical protein
LIVRGAKSVAEKLTPAPAGTAGVGKKLTAAPTEVVVVL